MEGKNSKTKSVAYTVVTAWIGDCYEVFQVVVVDRMDYLFIISSLQTGSVQRMNSNLPERIRNQPSLNTILVKDYRGKQRGFQQHTSL